MTDQYLGLPIAPADTAFGLMAEYDADPHPKKVSLIAGAYRDENGLPWVLPSVKEAKARLSCDEIHEYLGIAGSPGMIKFAQSLTFSSQVAAVLEDNLVSIQTVSGTGANHMAALFLARHMRPGQVFIPSPTWINHHAIWAQTDVSITEYPYYDTKTRKVDFGGMLSVLEKSATSSDVVVLQACAHNPTGVDISRDQWKQVATLVKKKKLCVVFDSAYQGFATGDVDGDAWAIRYFVEHLILDGQSGCPGLFVAQSFSKNFGLYGERVGALHVAVPPHLSPKGALSALVSLARAEYSNPPRYGARIVETVLGDAQLKIQWKKDLLAMSSRITGMRRMLRKSLEDKATPGDWSHIESQIGMFSYTGLDSWMTMSRSIILNRLAALDTNTVSDALDFLGLKGATFGLLPLWDCPKIVGRASTVKLGPKTDAASTTHLLTPVVDAVTTDDRILVISGGIDGISCWGDILANASRGKHIRGTIIDGMSRDIDGSREIGFPVYGRGVTMISARNRVVQVESGTSLDMCGVTVSQDDYVIADNCGAVFVPAHRIEETLSLAEAIERRQSLMVKAVRSGEPVTDVMHDTQFDSIVADAPKQTYAEPPTLSPKRAITEDQELVAMFANSDTPGISDALDKLGICGQAIGIMPLTNYKKVYVGPAFTVRYVPASDPPGSVGDFIDDVTEGDFVVIDNGGRTDCTVWGDIMTQYAGLRGIAGSVIDGVCRDVNRAINDDFPLFTAGRWMRTGKDRVQVGGINEPIAVGKVRVNPRDIVVADANGVVIVPRDRAREVAEVARKIEQSEERIRQLIAGGASIAEAREQIGYHTLQRHG
ncbi:Aspartate aminotransferase cytoplasmic [Paramyrothecium foliicola]|nr:Aspartate aminotransferase cytoplasmic [Paramyrothecium foliicola]